MEGRDVDGGGEGRGKEMEPGNRPPASPASPAQPSPASDHNHKKMEVRPQTQWRASEKGNKALQREFIFLSRHYDWVILESEFLFSVWLRSCSLGGDGAGQGKRSYMYR